MIITKVRLQEEHPMSFTGPFSTQYWPLPSCDFNLDSSAGENGYLIKQIEGMGPTKVTGIVEGFDFNGVPIYGPFAEKRLLGFKVGLTPDLGMSYSQLRDDIYKFMGRSILISFMNESLIVAQTTGFITQADPVHFSNQPEIQVMIECVDGEMYAPAAVDIPLGTLATDTPLIVYEDGTAPTGIEFQFEVTTNQPFGFTISNHAKSWHAGYGTVDNNFQVQYPLLVGDVVTLSTHPKDKRATVLRSSVTYDVAGYINSGAVWPRLYPGVNPWGWSMDSGWMDWVSASYVPRFWGV